MYNPITIQANETAQCSLVPITEALYNAPNTPFFSDKKKAFIRLYLFNVSDIKICGAVRWWHVSESARLQRSGEKWRCRQVMHTFEPSVDRPTSGCGSNKRKKERKNNNFTYFLIYAEKHINSRMTTSSPSREYAVRRWSRYKVVS